MVLHCISLEEISPTPLTWPGTLFIRIDSESRPGLEIKDHSHVSILVLVAQVAASRLMSAKRHAQTAKPKGQKGQNDAIAGCEQHK